MRPENPQVMEVGQRQGNHMKVSLCTIDKNNTAACLALGVTAAQSELVAPNSKSLAWAESNQHCVPKGIYAEAEMVGFLMFEPRGNRVFSVHRFMIDKKHQQQALGYQAMLLVMEEIRGLQGETIYLSFRPENVVAKKLYEKLGFVFLMEEADGEIVFRHGPVRDIGSL